MSYYTVTHISWYDGERGKGSLTTNEVLTPAAEYLRSIDWPEDALVDLQSGLQSGGRVSPGFMDLRNIQIIDMFCHVSQCHPDVLFYVRGLGEEPLDVWVAVIRAGVVEKGHGPFDE